MHRVAGWLPPEWEIALLALADATVSKAAAQTLIRSGGVSCDPRFRWINWIFPNAPHVGRRAVFQL